MAFIHGKGAVVTLDADDLSAFANNITFNRTADSHDVTTFGKNSHVYQGGLGDGTAEITGIYDDGATGPRAIIEPLIGTVVDMTWKPAGTGASKPLDTVDVLVTAYEETAPVADMIAWSVKLQLSDAVATTAQGA